MRTRTLCRVRLMCMAGHWRGRSAVKGALGNVPQYPLAARPLTAPHTPARPYGPHMSSPVAGKRAAHSITLAILGRHKS